MKKSILLLGILLSFPLLLCAQTGLGLPPFGSFTSSGLDTVNNQNLNVFFAIPIASSEGRGLPLKLNLSYNSLIWQKSTSWVPVTDASGNATWGWQKDFPAGSISYITSTSNPVKCYQGSQFTWVTITHYSGYSYTDALGTPHGFPVNYWESDCPLGGQYNGGTYPPAYASDHSGYYLSQGYTNPIVLGPNGQKEGGGTFTASDVNGNFVTQTVVSSTETDWTDSVGNRALKIIYSPSKTAPTSIQYDFLDGNGNYQTITLKLQAYNIKTNFGCSVVEYTGTAYLPYELDIPSPVSGIIKYSFSYEPTPGNSGYYTGRLQQVTLPTGGSYKWTYSTTNDGINCSDGTTAGMSRTVNDNGNSSTWSYVRNTSNLTTTLTTPQLADTPNANDTVYTYNSLGQEVSKKIYADSPGTSLLRTINTAWASNGTPATSITILEDGSTQSEVATTSDSNGLLDSETEYDWGSGSPGAAIRTTTYSYQTSSNYTSQNLINLVTSKVVKDGTGIVQYRQDTTYDGVALTCPTGAAQHDDSGHPCTSNYRGNATAVTTYTIPATPSGGITRNSTYDWFGNLLTAQLSCCNTKIWTYSSTHQYSRPTTVQSGSSPAQLTTTYTYNAYTGLVASSVDQNGLETDYTYDFLRRPTQVAKKNGSTVGQSVSTTYDDIAFTTTTTTTIDSANSKKQITAMDTLGRALTTTIENASGTIFSIVKSEYNLAGRAYGASNPYTTGNPSIWTTSASDALGRVVSTTLQDNSRTTYAYTTNTVKMTDPTGKQRQSTYDAVGRLTIATEPDVANGNSLTLNTTYTYTVLDALVSVTTPDQHRTNNYDGLGQLLSTLTPEGGTTCFGSVSGSTCNTDGYDSFDNILLKRTDARGVLTSYTYDGLNRLTGTSYNVGSTGVPATATVSLTYGLDSSCVTGHGLGCIGQVITMTDGVGTENYTYNSLEQMTQLQKVIGTTTYTTSYQYNVAGEVTQITYPSGRVIQQSIDSIGRVCEIAPSTTGCGTAASPYATGYGYDAASHVTGFKYGNGIYASLGFSGDRLQLNCVDYSTTNRNGTCAHDSTTKFGLGYTYGTAGSNNGEIASITDSVDNGRSATYSYDGLRRLSTALTTGSANYPQWGLSWGYDRYGNRLNQTVTAGSGYQGSVTVAAATNHVTTSGYAYDPNGNMTNDGTNTMVYDAENHAVSATNQSSAGTYTYDGNGLRVKKISGSITTVYVFSGSKVIAEYDNGTSPSREYVYSGGTLLAKIDSSGTVYYHRDHLSNRLVTSSTGAVLEQLGHFPFGDTWYNASHDKLYFTTYERDAESNSDFAMARFYNSSVARFASPDPVGSRALAITDPQFLNRFSYTKNDPINGVDPQGLFPCFFEAHGFSETGYYYYLVGCLNNLPAPQAPPADHGGGGGGPGFCANKAAVKFVKSNQADAKKLADKLNVPVEFVLAVAADESQYGQYPTAVAANNYFGIHAGAIANANGSIGPYANNPIFAAWAPGTDGFLGSGNAFASIAKSDNASGETNATNFFTDIHAQFGVGTVNYVNNMLNVLKAVKARLKCP
jgi:RHS repeat-associated protein